jgi:hypothetical protein
VRIVSFGIINMKVGGFAGGAHLKKLKIMTGANGREQIVTIGAENFNKRRRNEKR